ncbi:cysteine hydrolase family protein [Serratia fonticola]|uniref:cysteine hydrolase family protein n=1 Tax=Serratia fonticola TaxID=47917 RepID=UPI0021787B9D|nr:isochorismatase family cysteine hydrolase [Serratia fonticola]CAI0878592.1 Peroxyureidoacrylate/ureidoacrylate amidohydrolase RutB [Serratia fonticola]CAI0910795.1 Peroxyureidoacrylate/ureidoacrylate amidohydrolase RutB [Serratia fonticola]
MFAIITNDLQYAAAYKSDERTSSYKKIEKNLINLFSLAREKNIPVIHLLLTLPDDDEKSQGKPPHVSFIANTTGHAILPEIHDQTDIIINKPKDSGFYNTTLDEKLKELNVDTVIVVGMQTQICIQTTSADAYFRGYKVIVPRDCVCSTRAEDTERSLKWLEDYCASVVLFDDLKVSLESINV